MSDSKKEATDPLLKILSSVQELPERVLATYVSLWQLEIWLRRMVYIEFRAAYGDDWEKHILTNRAKSSREVDDKLTHMPSPEADLLSYSTFGDVCSTIENKWDYFQTYLPPKHLWTAKLSEIKQIRHRVAHFRRGHSDDLQRTIQFIRDIDKGFWNFCTGFNDTFPVLPPSDDPVIKKFIHLNPFPYQKIDDDKWAIMGVADPKAWFAVNIEVVPRPWSKSNISYPIEGKPGYFYNLHISGRQQKTFDYRRYFKDTNKLHNHFVYMIPDAFSTSLNVTIPSVLGKDRIIEIIEELIRWLSNAFSSPMSRLSEDGVKAFADEMPEYILNPENPLAFLTPEMPCSFFGV